MKQLINLRFKTFILLLMAAFYKITAFAQDSTIQTTQQVNKTTTETSTHIEPWVWVAGGAVLIIILVALLRGNKSSGTTDKVTVTKTVTRDTDS
jgi:glucan phosphoethanolaminetransferase (alkaline phosphatase superfamily)